MAIDRPWGVVPDIAIPAIPQDERLWVPEPGKESVWFRPLMLDTVPADVRRRLVEEHLMDPRRYRASFGIPSVAM